ncbi:MAG: hypothetical protein NTV34_08760, partial [Proteobacteria bacterium]|nr:hypothetical protein [Pseudomonadota bacterium]
MNTLLTLRLILRLILRIVNFRLGWVSKIPLRYVQSFGEGKASGEVKRSILGFTAALSPLETVSLGISISILLSIVISAGSCLAGPPHSQTIPEEYLSTGEQSTALANGGSLSSGGYGAVRANPAMLAAEKQYTLGGGYHWPSKGREYYQGGIVDAKTASVAAGFSYTSSLNNYEGAWAKDGSVMAEDTPVRRRANVGLGQSFKTFSLGLGGGFIEAADPTKTFSEDSDRVKGFTLGAGAVIGIAANIRAGLSVENLANKKVSFAAPTIYRAGLVWGAVKDFSVFLDLRSREAVLSYDAPPPAIGLFKTEQSSSKEVESEKGFVLGGLVRIYDLLRVSAATGMSVQGSRSSATAAGGLALVNKAFTFAYGA